MVVEATIVPDVPVIVTTDGLVVIAAVLLAVKLTTVDDLVEEVAVHVGEIVAVTPAGRPAAERLTLPLNPFCDIREIVEFSELPGLR